MVRTRRFSAVLLNIVATARMADAQDVSYPPQLPGGRAVASVTSDEFLKPPDTLRDGVQIAKMPPTVDFLYYGEQTYAAKTWSAWGDGLAVGDKYYSSIGDHEAPSGNAFLYEYDATRREVKTLVDVKKLLGFVGNVLLARDAWLAHTGVLGWVVSRPRRARSCYGISFRMNNGT